jgi:hypothetical protein
MTAAIAIALLVLAGAVGLARQRAPRGRRRDVLSVALVVLALSAVFVLCFSLGSFVKMLRP